LGAVKLDHVIIAVRDLGEAALWMEARFGLASIEGGRHPGWGTANRIIPLGDVYIELVTVIDGDQAQRSAFGRWVARSGNREASLLGWSVRSPNLDQVARRLSLTVGERSRTRADGQRVQWRLAGVQGPPTSRSCRSSSSGVRGRGSPAALRPRIRLESSALWSYFSAGTRRSWPRGSALTPFRSGFGRETRP
jgi:hypothetical protein